MTDDLASGPKCIDANAKQFACDVCGAQAEIVIARCDGELKGYRRPSGPPHPRCARHLAVAFQEEVS